MIKFFRKIRKKLLTENKFSKYVLYAIGEIVLVVIGILIAIQINTWNTFKKERKSEEIYLYRLSEDLIKDTTNISNIINISKSKRTAIEYLYTIQSLNTHQGIDTLKVIENLELSKSLGWAHYNVETGTLEELRSTGNFKIIQKSILRSRINSYYHNAEDEYKRIDARRTDYPNEVYSLVPKQPKEGPFNSYSLREDIISKAEIIDYINSPIFKRKLTSALNLSEFIIERENVLLNQAKELLSKLEYELRNKNGIKEIN